MIHIGENHLEILCTAVGQWQVGKLFDAQKNKLLDAIFPRTCTEASWPADQSRIKIYTSKDAAAIFDDNYREYSAPIKFGLACGLVEESSLFGLGAKAALTQIHKEVRTAKVFIKRWYPNHVHQLSIGSSQIQNANSSTFAIEATHIIYRVSYAAALILVLKIEVNEDEPIDTVEEQVKQLLRDSAVNKERLDKILAEKSWTAAAYGDFKEKGRKPLIINTTERICLFLTTGSWQSIITAVPYFAAVRPIQWYFPNAQVTKFFPMEPIEHYEFSESMSRIKALVDTAAAMLRKLRVIRVKFSRFAARIEDSYKAIHAQLQTRLESAKDCAQKTHQGRMSLKEFGIKVHEMTARTHDLNKWEKCISMLKEEVEMVATCYAEFQASGVQIFTEPYQTTTFNNVCFTLAVPPVSSETLLALRDQKDFVLCNCWHSKENQHFKWFHQTKLRFLDFVKANPDSEITFCCCIQPARSEDTMQEPCYVSYYKNKKMNPQFHPPSAPVNLSHKLQGASVELRWERPRYGDVESYMITYKKNNISESQKEEEISVKHVHECQYMLSSLIQNLDYIVSVEAVTPVGSSAKSSIQVCISQIPWSIELREVPVKKPATGTFQNESAVHSHPLAQHPLVHSHPALSMQQHPSTSMRTADKEAKQMSLPIKLLPQLACWDVDSTLADSQLFKLLKTGEKILKDGQVTIKRYFFGEQRRTYPTETVILLLGSGDCGKGELLDMMANYLLGIQWDDNGRVTVAEENNESNSNSITCYTLFPGEEKRDWNIPITLIVSTWEEPQRETDPTDPKMSLPLQKLFSGQPFVGIEHIDAFCLVTKSSDSRLTKTQFLLFNAVNELVDGFVPKNTFIFINYCDSGDSPVLDAIDQMGISYLKAFQFNTKPINEKWQFKKSAANEIWWEDSFDSFEKFFKTVQTLEPRLMPISYFDQRALSCLEIACSVRLELVKRRQVQLFTIEQLINNICACSWNSDVSFRVTDFIVRTTANDHGNNSANCQQCRLTCHYPCFLVNSSSLYACNAMGCHESVDVQYRSLKLSLKNPTERNIEWPTKTRPTRPLRVAIFPKQNYLCKGCGCPFSSHKVESYRFITTNEEKLWTKSAIQKRFVLKQKDMSSQSAVLSALQSCRGKAEEALQMAKQQACLCYRQFDEYKHYPVGPTPTYNKRLDAELPDMMTSLKF